METVECAGEDPHRTLAALALACRIAIEHSFALTRASRTTTGKIPIQLPAVTVTIGHSRDTGAEDEEVEDEEMKGGN